MERLVIQRAFDFVKEGVWKPPKRPKNNSAVSNASKATYRFQMADGNVMADLVWKRDKHTGLEPIHQAHIIRLLITEVYATHVSLFEADDPKTALDIPFFTEYERNGFVYRAHPDYRGEGAYYDWAKVQWEVGNDPITDEPIYKPYIARILGFIQQESGEIQAIIHSVKEERKGLCGHGAFGHYWHLEVEGTDACHRPILRLVSVDTLLEHVCMIPYKETDTFMWVHLWNPSEWPGCFQTILPPGQEHQAFQNN